MEELEDRLRSARYPKKETALNRITITPLDQPDVPGSPVALVFVPDQMNQLGGMKDAWCADLPWESGEFYRIYARTIPLGDSYEEIYTYMRPLDPDAGPLSGNADTLDEAMHVCGEDVVKLARRRRWRDHMLTHEPPNG